MTISRDNSPSTRLRYFVAGPSWKAGPYSRMRCMDRFLWSRLSNEGSGWSCLEQAEIDFDLRLHRDGLAVLLTRAELPLFNRFNGLLVQA
jgi:hypothetical protein